MPIIKRTRRKTNQKKSRRKHRPTKEDPAATDKKDDESATPKDKPDTVETPKKSADDLKKEYESKLAKYKTDLKAYEEKIDAGKKQVDELNARFGEWYYVISAENFNKLHLRRMDLVKEKAKAAGDDRKNDKKTGAPADRDPFATWTAAKTKSIQMHPEKNADTVDPEKTPADKKPAKKVDK